MPLGDGGAIVAQTLELADLLHQELVGKEHVLVGRVEVVILIPTLIDGAILQDTVIEVTSALADTNIAHPESHMLKLEAGARLHVGMVFLDGHVVHVGVNLLAGLEEAIGVSAENLQLVLANSKEVVISTANMSGVMHPGVVAGRDGRSDSIQRLENNALLETVAMVVVIARLRHDVSLLSWEGTLKPTQNQ